MCRITNPLSAKPREPGYGILNRWFDNNGCDGIQRHGVAIRGYTTETAHSHEECHRGGTVGAGIHGHTPEKLDDGHWLGKSCDKED